MGTVLEAKKKSYQGPISPLYFLNFIFLEGGRCNRIGLFEFYKWYYVLCYPYLLIFFQSQLDIVAHALAYL